MHGLTDYFDTKNTKGYKTPKEALNDRIALMDMIMENYLDTVLEGDPEGLVFSRGIKLSEEQVEAHYNNPPKDRKNMTYNAAFAKEAAKAMALINKREKATTEETVLPFLRLKELFNLSEFGELALTMAIAVHIDLKYSRMFSFIAHETGLQIPTAGAALALYESVHNEDTRDEEIQNLLLLSIWDKKMLSAQYKPLLHTQLVLHRRVLDYILSPEAFISGNGNLGEDLYFEGEKIGESGFLTVFRYKDTVEDKTKRPRFFQEEMERIREMKVGSPESSGFIYIESTDLGDVNSLLFDIAEDLHKPLYVLNADTIISKTEMTREEIMEALQGDFLQMQLYPGMLLIELNNIEGKPEHELRAINNHTAVFLSLLREQLSKQRIFLCGSSLMPKYHFPVSLSPIPINMTIPDSERRLKIWEYYSETENIDFEKEVSLEDLANCYKLSLTQIRGIVRQAAERYGGRPVSRDDILSLLRRESKTNFGNLATEIVTRYTWDDLALSWEQREILQLACDRYRLKNRLEQKYGITGKSAAYGNGVSIILYGPPGTGKTMAAQVVANETGLPLYRIDLSQIYSKYIGETQKNLATIFAEAKKTNVILFFDEADSLFSKRTDVKDSNDKHSNAESAFLLQKMEEYEGITILATNLYQNFDPAFMRRLTYAVHFESPDEKMREYLWQNILPKTVPMDPTIDYEFLAEHFDLSGSNIRSILYCAAYMALDKKKMITAEEITLAIKIEYEKLGRMANAGVMGKYSVYLLDHKPQNEETSDI